MKVLIIAIAFAFPVVGAAEVKPQADGRFQLVRLDDHWRQFFMIDTHTGRVWKEKCNVNASGNVCTPHAWEEMPRIDLEASPVVRIDKKDAFARLVNGEMSPADAEEVLGKKK